MPPRTRLFRHVLHASDFSPASKKAFATALAVARVNRSALTILHVLTPVVPVTGEGFVSPETYLRIEAAARAAAGKQLGRLVARARAAGIRVKALLLIGVAHEQITRAARSRRADLVVLGTHGRTGLARVLLGSVAARVLPVAPCPVLTVRGG